MRLWRTILLASAISSAFGTTTQRNACINSLRQIDGAKEQLRVQSKLKDGDVVTITEISSLIKGGFPTCLAGGSYALNPIGTDPTCSISGHSLSARTVVAVKKSIPIEHPVLLVLPPILVLLIALLFRRVERQRENRSKQLIRL